MSVEEKLLKCQQTLKAPKSQYNSFGKYKYRTCEDILTGLKKVLVDNNCTVVIQDDIEMIGDRFYIKATVKFIDCENGEFIETYAYAREDDKKTGMDLSQLTGATSSYARKYALNGMFAIDDTKDVDAMKPTSVPTGKVTKAQAQEIIKALQGKFGADAPAKLKEFGYNSTSEIPSDKFEELMGKLK